MPKRNLTFANSAGYLGNFWMQAAARDGRYTAYPSAPRQAPEPTRPPRPRRREIAPATRSVRRAL